MSQGCFKVSQRFRMCWIGFKVNQHVRQARRQVLCCIGRLRILLFLFTTGFPILRSHSLQSFDVFVSVLSVLVWGGIVDVCGF